MNGRELQEDWTTYPSLGNLLVQSTLVRTAILAFFSATPLYREMTSMKAVWFVVVRSVACILEETRNDMYVKRRGPSERRKDPDASEEDHFQA